MERIMSVLVALMLVLGLSPVFAADPTFSDTPSVPAVEMPANPLPPAHAAPDFGGTSISVTNSPDVNIKSKEMKSSKYHGKIKKATKRVPKQVSETTIPAAPAAQDDCPVSK